MPSAKHNFTMANATVMRALGVLIYLCGLIFILLLIPITTVYVGVDP